MRTATVRDLRNHYADLLKWIEAGEEIAITRRGKTIARLVPETPGHDAVFDWSKSAALTRDRTNEIPLTEEQSRILREEAGGKW
ncbi:MAG: type II toxin-antitoxin system prevent-host-death family antitoxin [Chthoniobacterales bacterium]